MSDDLVLVADVDREPVRWLWPGRIPLGKVTVLDGDPGTGKSTLTLTITAVPGRRPARARRRHPAQRRGRHRRHHPPPA